jgi:heme/copper-type cytochrome/quinol oxidase subunit 3
MSLDANPPVLVGHDGHGPVGHGPVGHDSPEVVGDRQKMGVILLIVADVAFVLSLVFTYLYLRGLNTEGGWLSQDEPRTASTPLGWLVAGVMAASWVAYRWSEIGARSGQRERLLLGVGVANLLVVVDLILQVYQMVSANLRVDYGSYASSFMALAGYHVFHLALTLFIGIGLWNRARLGRFADNHWHVRLVGYWWTWVAISAVITAAVTSLTASGHVPS